MGLLDLIFKNVKSEYLLDIEIMCDIFLLDTSMDCNVVLVAGDVTYVH